MKVHSIYMTLLAAAIVLGSCKKDKNDDTIKKGSNSNPVVTPIPPRVPFLTAGKWSLGSYTISYVENGEGKVDNRYAQMKECEKDNFLSFSVGGKLVDDEDATKCDAADPQTRELAWAFEDSEAKLVIIDGGARETMLVVDLNGSMLKLSSTDIQNGIEYTTIKTYNHIP